MPVVGIRIWLFGYVPFDTFILPIVRSEYVIAAGFVVPTDCVVELKKEPNKGATPGPVHSTATARPTPGIYRYRGGPVRGGIVLIVLLWAKIMCFVSDIIS